MSEQDVDTVGGSDVGTLLPGVPHEAEHNSGRPISWTGTTIVVIGFIIGGVGFCPSPNWIVFWIGAAVALIGCFVLLFSKAMTTDWY